MFEAGRASTSHFRPRVANTVSTSSTKPPVRMPTPKVCMKPSEFIAIVTTPATTPALPTIRMFLLGDFSSIDLIPPSKTFVMNDCRPGTEEKYHCRTHHAGPVIAWVKIPSDYPDNKQSASCTAPTLGSEPLLERFKSSAGHYHSPCLISNKVYHPLSRITPPGVYTPRRHGSYQGSKSTYQTPGNCG
jgi:hypothetical protein